MSGEAPKQRRKLSAILMVDVADYSRMMGADEEATGGLIGEFHLRVKSLIEAHEGRVVDTAGDSVFGEFDSVVNAVRCAQLVQDRQATENKRQPRERRFEARIGVHLGDVVVEDYRVYGDGVNIAARLEQLAEPGGIWISEAVFQQVRSKLDLAFEDMGMRELKNIQYPIRLYRVAAKVPRPDRASTKPPEIPASRGDRSGLVWIDRLRETPIIMMLSVGAVLLVSPIFLFPTGGVFPTGGGVLIGLALGSVWSEASGRPGNFLIALGAGIAAGAAFTNWSGVTNGMFILGGLVVAAVGLGRNLSRTRQSARSPE